MKPVILTDECIPRDVITAFVSEGFTVHTAYSCGLAAKSDTDVFAYAVKHRLVLLTFDRGFGDIFRFTYAKTQGVVIILIKGMARDEITQIPLAFFNTNPDIVGKLVIIGTRKIRIVQR